MDLHAAGHLLWGAPPGVLPVPLLASRTANACDVPEASKGCAISNMSGRYNAVHVGNMVYSMLAGHLAMWAPRTSAQVPPPRSRPLARRGTPVLPPGGPMRRSPEAVRHRAAGRSSGPARQLLSTHKPDCMQWAHQCSTTMHMRASHRRGVPGKLPGTTGGLLRPSARPLPQTAAVAHAQAEKRLDSIMQGLTWAGAQGMQTLDLCQDALYRGCAPHALCARPGRAAQSSPMRPARCRFCHCLRLSTCQSPTLDGANPKGWSVLTLI